MLPGTYSIMAKQRQWLPVELARKQYPSNSTAFAATNIPYHSFAFYDGVHPPSPTKH